ncbi:helix-turn-helix domain-containing protein [Methylocystis parvus]|uniref:helix-turn-helix domain-containing protein n=1 Tax=Methylocystis parvus TaxID=134 RepID=UPI003C788E20
MSLQCIDPKPFPIAGLSAAAAAAALGVPAAALAARSRCRAPVARARQLAVYLHHVALGASLSACARAFGRDRATVRHACAVIEDMRDDPRIDCWAARLEQALAAQCDMIFRLIRTLEGAAR